MNKNKLKSYAPAARREFIQAVTDRANAVGLFSDKNILPVEVKGDVAIIGGKSFPLRVADQRKKLERRIGRSGFEQTMEAVAYTWFNRFVALRYMELHDYLEHGYRVLSNRNGSHIPEILEHATEVNLTGLNHDLVVELKLDGNRDAELYRMLVVAQCNALHSAMPFLFERIGGAAELLLPDNLLHSDALIRKLVTEINEEDWLEVEIIGWLYQFYISEKKDQVIGKVVKSEDIPAATQLFTPNWIVKYMVHNTLGRQWLATYPNSPLREKMEYYIEPAEQTDEIKTQLTAITPKELDPETLTLLDPACGSGHILVEAYDLFKNIYLERGYRTRDVTRLILEKNLYGLEIDDRAAQLAGFALLMKARADDRHILDSDNPVQLNILAIQESKELNIDEIARVLLQERVITMGTTKPQQQHFFQPVARQLPLSGTEKPDVTREQLSSLLGLFKDGKMFGSLLVIPDKFKEALPKFRTLVAKAAQWDVQSIYIASLLLPMVKQAELLSRKYNFVVTNPPYMGGKGMNPSFKAFAQANYPGNKSDLFAMFADRIIGMVKRKGFVGLMTPFTWMFLSSYEKLRSRMLNDNMLTSLIRPEYHAFFDSAYVPICSFVIHSIVLPRYKGTFIDLNSFYGSDLQPLKACEAIKNPKCSWRFNASAYDFKKIPGSPIAYLVSEKIADAFERFKPLGEVLEIKAGMSTTDNQLFLRQWFEINYGDFNHNLSSRSQAQGSQFRWFPYIKGGSFRRWYGNNDYVVNWKNDGEDIRQYIAERPEKQVGGRLVNMEFFFKECLAWTRISSGSFSARYYPNGYIFSDASNGGFGKKEHIGLALLLINSKIITSILAVISPTLTFNAGDVAKLPTNIAGGRISFFTTLTKISQNDWDSYETSWDFTSIPLLHADYLQQTLNATYTKLRTHWRETTLEMQRLEEENNHIFIEAYRLQDELTPEVPLSEITLTCNPHYRYSGDKTEEELEALLLADTIKEFISYGIGCMMGRYSLDQSGLVYAHEENIDFDPSKYRTFPADPDGIVPINDMEWFPDEVANRIVEFIRVTLPPETLNENLKFVANTLSPKSGETPQDTVRRYLSASFFRDHLQTYKRRPIYWLFSSGKERAFQCLVYLHRYNEGTLSRMRNEYVTPLFGKMNARIDFLKHDIEAASSASLRNKLQKQLDSLKKKLAELTAFDDELRHYADKRIKLDLDDGVKANYGKFGKLLAEVKAVTGD
jgi:type II restriction/modification system DNA methylase subunit YeeA